jgi:hypothetical protein
MLANRRHGCRRSIMKRKILFIFLVFVIVTQVPFAYRRYRLSRLNKTVQQLASQRVPQQTENGYIDYRGVIHVHTALGGHSTGNFAELISAAKANQLDFVIMTEHPQSEFDTSAMTLNGAHEGVLFINGNEVATANGDRLLLIPGSSLAASMNTQPTQEIIEKQKAAGGLALAAYPAESQNWQSTSVDGVEIYNLFTNARKYKPLIGFFDGLWSYGSYPDLMFANFFERPAENLNRWDQTITARHRRLVAIAGNDAHSNIGLNLNDASGKQWLGIKLDPYVRSFHTVRTHVLIPPDKGLTRESLLEAISQGHCYVSFDLFADPGGFSFAVTAVPPKIMGDEIAFAGGLRLQTSAPLASRFVLVKDGAVMEQKSGLAAEFSIGAAGSYRLEVYLDSLPSPAKGQPWILSNPIYIR